VDICTLKFGGKKHPWVDSKIKGDNCEPPLKVVVDILFLQCSFSDNTKTNKHNEVRIELTSCD